MVKRNFNIATFFKKYEMCKYLWILICMMLTIHNIHDIHYAQTFFAEKLRSSYRILNKLKTFILYWHEKIYIFFKISEIDSIKIQGKKLSFIKYAY